MMTPADRAREVDEVGESTEKKETTTLQGGAAEDGEQQQKKKMKASTMADDPHMEEAVTLESLRQKMADFAKERDWDQFHSPRNLLLALVGEMGELSEIFQWKGEVPRGLPGWEEKEKEHLGEELSDVLLYLVRLSDICGVDLGKAALRKIELNALKYPALLCKGSSKKHIHYNSEAGSNSNGSFEGI